MPPTNDPPRSRGPRSRRSIAHVPRSKMTAGVDKENATTDIGATQPSEPRAKPPMNDKKSRSKSLGPGGLDALQNSNGNRRKSTASVPLKSILKPTVPVSPVQNIPSFEETRKPTPVRRSPRKSSAVENEGNGQGKEGLLIDFGTPARPPASGADNQANPFDSFNASSAIAAARERVEREQRERERKMILEQREARRKSMANRRVSFAPEATLHTWNVVEIPDDSTSSSNSNSTRRASSLTASANQQPAPSPSHSESPASPGDVDSDIAFSPVQHDDLQQLRNRPASVGNYIGDPHHLSSSPFSGSSVEGSDDTEAQGLASAEEKDQSSGSDSGFDGESTAMSMDDITARSPTTGQSEESNSSSDSSARLNEALRQARQEAGMRPVDSEGEIGDMSMEMADQEITGAFQPWIKKGQRQSFDWGDISARNDQENVDPSKRSSTHSQETSDNEDEDMSMEVTNAIGGILPNGPGRRQSAARRKSSGEESDYDEQTMELTNAIGGIAQPASPAKSTGSNNDGNEEEEMTMEFTSTVGGVIGKNSAPALMAGQKSPEQIGSYTPEPRERNFSEWSNDEEDDMDGADMEMTGAIGGILPTIREQPEEQDDDQTMGMDVTTAMGKILPSQLEASSKGQAKRVMELESDAGQLGSSPFQESVRQSPAKSPASFHVTAVASESGSPSLASVRSRRPRSSAGSRTSTTPISNPRKSLSPAKKLSSPLKQATPPVNRPSTPGDTPPSSNAYSRNASPKKLFQPEIQQQTSNRSPRKSLFENNPETGESTPSSVLHPRKRRSSGLGIDKEGLGSPRVAALLDTRRSIGEEIPRFEPQEQRPQGVRFEDPVKLHQEVDREREEEEYREDGHINPAQPSEQDTTSSLRDMISSLTPKKYNKVGSRKSLHPGSARGLLGKRPIELDEDDDESDKSPKRLKGREPSPVKNIRLPAPTTVEETVGRSPSRRSRSASPIKESTTPTQEPKAGAVLTSPVKDGKSPNPEAEPHQMDGENADVEEELHPIQLQDFLNMTNIHFMELTTTKRRHTTAPESASKKTRLSDENASKPSSFEDCVAAGFCTVPMLELFQHSCRELKSYISEGRQVIRSIEAETYADNPPLFREYIKSPADIRLLMDNQFRNVKTHARLLSKATWYDWRMKLLEGLKDGLNRHVDEMKGDSNFLSKYEVLLNSVVPELVQKHASLEKEATSMQQLADEMENSDKAELHDAREKLSSVDEEIAQKKRQLQELQEEVQDKSDTIETGTGRKSEFIAQIQEAERVKEECRGWGAKEISDLRFAVRTIERQTGWSIVSAASSPAGPLLTMSYRNQLKLTFHPGALRIQSPSVSGENANMPLDLTYAPEKPAIKLSPIASLILNAVQNHLPTINQPKTPPKHLVQFITAAWNLVLALEEETRLLNLHGMTKLSLVSESRTLRARCTLLSNAFKPSNKHKKPSTAMSKRIDLDFAVSTRVISNKDDELGSMDLDTAINASKVYGFGKENELDVSEGKMGAILSREASSGSSDGIVFGKGIWHRAVKVLAEHVF